MPAAAAQARAVRPSARADLPVHDRDVGALLLLRHALAARALHDEISAAGRPCRRCASGLLAVKRALESVFGPLDVQPLSSQIWGFYTGLVYFTPIFGGLLADRVLGQRRTVVIGAVLMAIGHFMMAVEQLFLFALLALILGSGCFKPNISTQVGGLYAPGDHAPRPRLFDLLCRHQCRRVSGAAGLRHARRGSRLALRLRRRRRRHVHRALHLSLCAAASAAGRIAQGESGAHRTPRRSAATEWRAIAALLVLFVPNTLFWACYEQIGNTTILWIDADIDRGIDLFGSDGADTDDLVSRLQSVHDLRLHAVRRRAVGAAGGARQRAVDRHQDGARLFRRRPRPI